MPMSSQITGVHTVGVPVTDQDRAIDFYVGTLGFDKRLDADMGGGHRWIEVAPGGSAITIALVAAHEGVLAGVETGIRFTAADADAVHAAMRASGVGAALHVVIYLVCGILLIRNGDRLARGWSATLKTPASLRRRSTLERSAIACSASTSSWPVFAIWPASSPSWFSIRGGTKRAG